MTHTPRLPHFVTYSIKHPLLDFVFSSLTVWKTKVIDSTRDPDEEMPKSTRAQKKAALATQQAAIPAHSTPIDSSSTLPVYFHREHTPPYGFLSQWYASSFYDPAANITYTSAEQRMMHHKALLCADAATASLILSSSDPGEQKALGRKVKGFREKEKDWDRIKFETAVEGNWLKFTRATEHGAWLKARLLETGERVLAEASRSDRVWGIGLNAGEAGDRLGEWGENLLGKALMSVRERIREEERKKTGEGEGEIDGSEHTP